MHCSGAEIMTKCKANTEFHRVLSSFYSILKFKDNTEYMFGVK